MSKKEGKREGGGGEEEEERDQIAGLLAAVICEHRGEGRECEEEGEGQEGEVESAVVLCCAVSEVSSLLCASSSMARALNLLFDVGSGDDTPSQPPYAYARAIRCPVLTYCMVVPSAYASTL
eukprot:3191510-Rhodomonas_salina.1